MSFIKNLLKRSQAARMVKGNGRSRWSRRRRLSIQLLEQRLLLTGVAGDFDGDGYDDLTVGVPLEDVAFGGGNIVNAGAVNVIYGSEAGLTATANQLFDQNSPDVHGSAESNDRFGFALAAGDFNADGFDDLAVGVPYEDVNGAIDAGAVQVIYGSGFGLIPTGFLFIPENQLWHQDNIDNQDSGAEAGDRFGFSLAVGDFDGDGDDDLAIGAPGESLGSASFAGAVTVLLGSPTEGLVGTAAQQWHQNSSGIAGGAESGDNFGFALAAGRFNDGDRDDLAIGVPFEDVTVTPEDGTKVDGTDSGAVNILYGSSNGLTAAGNRIINQLDLGGILEEGDRFGYALAAGNFNGLVGQDDLAIGVPYENVEEVDAGMVHVVFGTADGLDVLQNQELESPDAQEGSLFGYALAAGDFGVFSVVDLAIGAPFRNVAGAEHAGAVFVAYGSGSGLNVSDDYFTQGADDVSGAAEAGDLFGYSLVAGDFGNGGLMDLAVGVPLENLDGSINAGVVQVLYSDVILGGGGDELWHQGTAGIIGSAEAGDSFGCGLAGGSLGEGTVSCLRTIEDQAPSVPTSPTVQNDPNADPLSDAEIANIQKYISHELDGNIAGYQLAIAQDGELLYEFSDGKARLDSDPNDNSDDSLDMTNDHRIDIGSVSKVITAITVLVAVDDNLIDLNEPFYTYLNAGFPASEIDATVKQITVLELLMQTSGLRDLNGSESDRDDVRNVLSQPRKMYNCYDFAASGWPAPPSRCVREYNNWNFAMLRYVIEGVAELPVSNNPDKDAARVEDAATYNQFVEESWVASVDPFDDEPAACLSAPPMSYHTVVDGALVETAVESADVPTTVCGAGGWRASAEDMIDILNGIRIGAILSPAMNNLLLDVTLADASLTPGTTALSWETPWTNTLSPGTKNLGKNGGISQKMRTYITRLPENVDAVLLTNTNGVPIDPTVATTSPTTVLRDAYANKDPEAIVLGTFVDDDIVVRLNSDEPDFLEVLIGGSLVLTRLACTVETLSILSLSGDDRITIESLPAGIHVVVNGFTGDDTVDIGGGDLDAIFGSITVQGSIGDDDVILNDTNDSGNDPYGFFNNFFHKSLHIFSITLESVSQLRLEANDGNNTINVSSLIDHTPLVVRGNDGEDTVTITTAQSVRAEGGNNDDTLTGGPGGDDLNGGSGDDSIDGNGGNDSLFGGDGDDAIWGGEGNDQIGGNDGEDSLYGGVGNDTLEGGADSDLLFGEENNDHLIGGHHGANLPQDVLDLSPDTLYGGPGNDAILGDNGEFFLLLFSDEFGGTDLIYGGTGNDTIFAQGGNDEVYGNDGDDFITGGDGDDTVLGGSFLPMGVPPMADGDDFISGGDGDDTVYGDNVDLAFPPFFSFNGGDDELLGGDGDDTIFGQAGHDDLEGGRDDDTLFGGVGNDELRGGSGTDLLVGDVGIDLMFGNAGPDTLDGGNDNDTLVGGSENDELRGGSGDDLLTGESGDDLLVGGLGLDTLDGGADNDGLIGGNQGGFGVQADLSADSLNGGDGNDVILGDSGRINPFFIPVFDVLGGNDSIQGGAGNDTIYGQGGDDFIGGWLGNDSIFGGAGNDVASGDADNDVVEGQSGNDLVAGGEGNDTVTGGSGNDILVGGVFSVGAIVVAETGDDLLEGGDGQDSLFGDSWAFGAPLNFGVLGGNDTLRGGSGNDLAVGQSGNDSLTGDAGNDTLLGVDGNDVIRGGAGNDQLGGGAGHDLLLGEDGVDALTGGDGRDVLIGGLNTDTLVGGAEDDILIAGTTSHDASDVALNQILDEWTSARDYQIRVKNLKGTGKGPDFNNRLNGTVFLKKNGPNATVFDDDDSDDLTGSTGDDWFLFDPQLDELRDRLGGENKN